MPLRICFVCLGNICRSPTAEGVMRALVTRAGLADHIEIDSAGTSAMHAGGRPDERSTETAARRGIALTSRARGFESADFARFDYVLAMDADNRRNLARIAPAERRAHVDLLRNFDPAAPSDAEVPDPYYGGGQGFEDVFDIIEAACEGLLEHLRAQLPETPPRGDGERGDGYLR